MRLDPDVGRGHVSVPHGWDVTNVNLLLNDVKPGQGYGEGYGYYTK